MYYDYFGLKQPPFKITPDTSLFYPGGNRGAVLEALIYAICSGEGIVKVVGEVGSGKTMICRMLQEELPNNVEIVYLANPSLSPENILHAIAFELKLSIQSNSSRLQVMNKLQEYLLQKHSSGYQVVVFVEEAQSMPIATLEEIRLLSNLETQQNKLLQIILFGQPELDHMIGQPEIRQLKERITYSFQLNPFKTNDIKDYLNTRLRACGYRSGEIFSKPAIKKIEHYSKGLVRRINILADKSMLAAYASNTNQVAVKHVGQAARDSEFITNWRRFYIPAVVSLLFLAVAISIFWHKQTGTDATNPQVTPELSVKQSNRMTEPGVSTDGFSQAIPKEKESVNEPDALSSVSTHKPFGQVAVMAPQEATENLENKAKTISNNILSQSYADQQMSEVSVDESEFNVEEKVDMALSTANKNSQPLAVLEDLKNENEQENSQQRSNISETEHDLIGLEQVFELQDLGDSRLSNQEMLMMKRQLENLPPEVALQYDMSANEDTCMLCWSIIYRSLQDSENL